MTKEYIEREAAIEAVQNHFDDGGFDGYTEGQLMMTRICAIPASDVVEVVRCADCKYSIMHQFPFSYEKVLACHDPHGVMIRSVQPTHFCAYGERKEGEAETKLKEGHEDV